MPRVGDLLGDADGAQFQRLRELRLRKEPALVVLFTDDADEVALHYEEDPEVRAYVPCPGAACPLCYIGSPPQDYILLPIVNLESRAVEVLKISKVRGPGTLRAALAPMLEDPSIASKLVFIRRVGMDYRVESRDLPPSTSRCEDAVAAFIEARNAGLKFDSAFVHRTSAELAEVERIKRKLEIIGGYGQGTQGERKSDAAQ